MTAGPVAIIPVRDGVLAAGGHEVAAEVAAIATTTSAGPGTDARSEPRTILIGSVLGTAAGALAGLVRTVSLAEVGDFRPAAWAAVLAPLVADATALVLPASPDGRDLGARLAAELNWPLLSNAMTVAADRVVVVHHGGLVQSVVRPDGPFVATLQPGVRGVEGSMGDAVVVETLDLAIAAHTASAADAELIEIEAADATTIDLAEASRIVGGGAGLLRTDDPDGTFAALTEVGASIGAAMGATRVVTDAGPVSHARQIGTTGVVVNPELYVAFGISGAVQHTAGLGDPRHVISVNTDPHCPMMSMADLAVVADAPATLAALARRLSDRAERDGAERDGAQHPHAPVPSGATGRPDDPEGQP